MIKPPRHMKIPGNVKVSKSGRLSMRAAVEVMVQGMPKSFSYLANALIQMGFGANPRNITPAKKIIMSYLYQMAKNKLLRPLKPSVIRTASGYKLGAVLWKRAA